jgi:NTE family protein
LIDGGDCLNSNERVGLVFSGGGARAAYEVGVLKAIFSDRCPAAAGQNTPEVFCGTGAGAFNAAVIASRLPRQRPRPVEYLESLWADEIPREGMARNNRVFRRRMDTAQFFDIPYMWRRPLTSWTHYFSDAGMILPELARRTWHGLIRGNFSAWLNLAIWHDTSPMRRLISESLSLEVIRGGEHAPVADGSPQRILRVVATRRGSGEAEVFRNSDFTDAVGYDLILASCALPVIFPSVTINGQEYLYGGLVMQTPLQPAVDAGCNVIHLVQNEPKSDAPLDGEEPNAREMLNRSLAVALSATLGRDLDSRRRANELIDGFEKVRAQTGVDVAPYLTHGTSRRVVVHQYRPKQTLGGKTGLLDFSRENIKATIAAGERDALAHNCAENGCIL